MYNKGLKQAARACLRDARQSPKKVVLVFLLVTLLLDTSYNLVSALYDQALSGSAGGLGALGLLKGYNLWFSLAPLAVTLIANLWSAGYTAYALRLSRGADAGTGDLLEGFRRFGRVLWLFILEYIFIFLWSLLLIIPGLVAAYRYRLALYALLDDPQITAREALNLSKRLTSGHKLELLWLDLSFWWYYLLLALFTGAASLPNLQELTQLDLGPVSQLVWTSWSAFTLTLSAELFSMVVQWFAFPYVQTTYAHAYNYLRRLGDSRYMGAQAPDGL